MSKAVELQTGWFTRQRNIHHKYRMTIDEMLLCWNYATMMKQRGLTLGDIAAQVGISKEGIRQWFERGLPEHCLTRLDDAIHALAPMDPPDDSTIRTWQTIMAEGWMIELQGYESTGNAGGQGLRHESPAEAARIARLPELARANAKVTKARTHCKRGHEWTPENTRLRPPQNYRECRTCTKMREAKRRESYVRPQSREPRPQA